MELYIIGYREIDHTYDSYIILSTSRTTFKDDDLSARPIHGRFFNIDNWVLLPISCNL